MSPIRFLLCLAAALWLIGHVPARASGVFVQGAAQPAQGRVRAVLARQLISNT